MLLSRKDNFSPESKEVLCATLVVLVAWVSGFLLNQCIIAVHIFVGATAPMALVNNSDFELCHCYISVV